MFQESRVHPKPDCGFTSLRTTKSFSENMRGKFLKERERVKILIKEIKQDIE